MTIAPQRFPGKFPPRDPNRKNNIGQILCADEHYKDNGTGWDKDF